MRDRHRQSKRQDKIESARRTRDAQQASGLGQAQQVQLPGVLPALLAPTTPRIENQTAHGSTGSTDLGMFTFATASKDQDVGEAEDESMVC